MCVSPRLASHHTTQGTLSNGTASELVTLHLWLRLLVKPTEKMMYVRGFAFMQPMAYYHHHARHMAQSMLLDAWNPKVYFRWGLGRALPEAPARQSGDVCVVCVSM